MGKRGKLVNCIGKKAASTTINQQETGTIDRSKAGTKLRISSKKSAGGGFESR
jgi:hypothetical protein